MIDRETHRAAVEAGYADLKGYIEQWGPKTFPPGDDPEEFEDEEDDEDAVPDFELPDDLDD